MGKKKRPTCFIIAGPNGAGKTTFALRYLLCDKVVFYDNSGPDPVRFFEQDKNGQEILNKNIYGKIIRCANGYKRNP